MLVFFLMIILFSFHYQTIFAYFIEEEQPIEDMVPRIQEIFEVRTEMWNTFLDSTDNNGLTIRETQKKLQGYVEDPLLKEDLKIYQQILIEPTSYEKINSLRIDEYHLLEGTNKRKKIQLTITWDLEGYDGISSETVNYILEMKKSKDIWLLRDYRVVPN